VIPSDAVSLSSKTPISRSTTLRDLLTRVTHNGWSRSDREIVSRFQPAQVSRLRKPRFHDSSGSFDTRHYCLDGSDPIGKSRIAISLCNGSTLLKSPMVKSRRLPRMLTRVLSRSTARIRSRDFENHKVSILRLNKTPMTQISR
jgi:hypothetical protein